MDFSKSLLHVSYQPTIHARANRVRDIAQTSARAICRLTSPKWRLNYHIDANCERVSIRTDYLFNKPHRLGCIWYSANHGYTDDTAVLRNSGESNSFIIIHMLILERNFHGMQLNHTCPDRKFQSNSMFDWENRINSLSKFVLHVNVHVMDLF